MNLFDMVKEGLRIARTSRALWLYGFFVGLGTTFNTGNKAQMHSAPAHPHVAAELFTGGTALLVIAGLVLTAAGLFMYFVSEGALIEGVTRLRRGILPTVRGGWRDGLAHGGVLFRIALLYGAITAGSLVVLAAPVLLAFKLSGTVLAVILAIPAAVIALPWLATLYMWKVFAARIAVLENRRARDAAGKARLFLHGRVFHGLKLIVAAFLGRMIVMLAGTTALAAVALFAFLVLKPFGLMHATVPVIALAATVVLPALFILISISGTTGSSIWTIGYLTQQEG